MPTARNGEVELYYESFGSDSDPALILVNGLGGQCISYRREWCEMFAAAGFHVTRFDNRDTGLSTKMDAAPDYRLSDMAGDVVALIDALGRERAHVLGVSMGGMIVQQLAIEHSERLVSMCSVMSTTGDPDVGRPSREALASLMTPPPPDREGVIRNQLEAARIYGSPAAYDEERISTWTGESYDRCFCPDGVKRQFQAIMASPARSEGLREVEIPALVMHGDQDRLIDISGGRRTAEMIPHARFVEIEGMGHDHPPLYWQRWIDEMKTHAASARS